jgi:hypothetical protein
MMTDRSLTVLKQQPGLVEAIVLTPEKEQDQVVGISIWNSKADADRFTHGQGLQLLEYYKPLLQAEPTFHSFDAERSTTEVASARAASR